MKKGILALLLVMIMATVAACGGTTNEPVSSSGANNTPSTQEASKEPSPDPTPEPTPEPQTAYKPGDKITFGDWEIILEKFSFDQSVSDEYLSSSADEGNKFLVLNFSITNNGTAAAEFSGMFDGVSIQATFKDQYEYNSSVTLLDGDLSNESVKPLASKKGYIVIEVPDSVAESEESLVLNLSEDDNNAVITLR